MSRERKVKSPRLWRASSKEELMELKDEVLGVIWFPVSECEEGVYSPQQTLEEVANLVEALLESSDLAWEVFEAIEGLDCRRPKDRDRIWEIVRSIVDREVKAVMKLRGWK